MDELGKIGAIVERYMVAYLWLHLPVVAVVGMVVGGEWLMPAVGAAVLAGAATLSWRSASGSPGTRYTMAVALMGIIAILVYQLDGDPWQIDMHMYFFAALAILTAFCDWRTLVVAAGTVAVHHLLLNFVYPAAVFPGGASFGRVVLHAVVVVLQTAVLSWLAWRLVLSFRQSETAVIEAHAARQAAEEASADRDRVSQQAESRRKDVMASIATNLQADVGKFVGILSAAASDTRTEAQAMDSMVDDVGRKASAAADSAQDVTSSVETVAAATEELAASVREVNRFIEESSEIARNAVSEVEMTNGTVEGLVAAAERIGNVVSLIQDIASQTNLLALNATIEAARAGDAGKGFAVVANEVKSLANQTAKATEDISTQVAAIQSVSANAVSAIRDIGKLIGKIEQAVSTISSSASAQGAAIDEIARSAQRAAQVTETVGSHVVDVSQIAGKLGSMSSERVAHAASLVDKAHDLTKQVDGFVERIRAG